jgi:hypothetical protein
MLDKNPYNPRTNPALSGHARRFVIQSVDVVHARIDRETKDTETFLKRLFTGPKATDAISTSMLFRRALAVYRQFVSGIQSDPKRLEAERGELTKNTTLPRQNRRTEAGVTNPSDQR